MEGEEPTQATQTYFDKRREGGQNSGFSDEDISDILCLLYPQSQAARLEVQRLAQQHSPFIIERDEADVVKPDYKLEDHPSRFEPRPVDHGNHALMLRLSSKVKNPALGFAFGRNPARCDIVFLRDPFRRVSNIHFRIFVNEYGTVMIEDQSTNGTFVDRKLLLSRPTDQTNEPTTKWVLSSGSVISIYLHQQSCDLNFLVRIPHRDEDYEQAYLNKVEEYFARLPARYGAETSRKLKHVEVPGANRQGVDGSLAPSPSHQQLSSPIKRRPRPYASGREWAGSGKYNKINRIGHGAFAVVYRVTSKYDGMPYAAKELDKRKFMKNGVLDLKVENEMKIMKRVQHPNIVRYIENFDWDDRLLVLIMEYVPEGDLGKLIKDWGPLPEDMGQIMSRQLINALAYLHANQITHRDVKPDNILISSRDPLEVKLTDFGLSKMVESDETFLHTFCGTLLYLAPEVYPEFAEYGTDGVRNRGRKVRRVLEQRYSHAVDIWSLGGVLFYSLTGSPPYPTENGTSHTELLHRIMTTELDVNPLEAQGISKLAIDFLCGMLCRIPTQRANVEELDGHPWLHNVGLNIEASQSNDVLTDEEGAVAVEYHEDRVSDSIGDESEKENGGRRNSRLFGEVGSSAIGSSGAIPEDLLNLPVAADTTMNGIEIVDSYDHGTAPYSRDSSVSRTDNHIRYRQATVSIGQDQSADQLQSLVENVASQSLGEPKAAQLDQASAAPHLSTRSPDFQSSKRKPPTHDTSEELEESRPPEKPEIKRLKSNGHFDEPVDLMEEYKLLAHMPQIRRLGSGRQIDGPVPKVQFWEQDRETWHLHYPEMTQLQWDAFAQAARDRGEEFGPRKSPLWTIAMKYFPPSSHHLDMSEKRELAPTAWMGDQCDATMATGTAQEFPPTATADAESIPDTAPCDTRVVPLRADDVAGRALGMIESHPDSCISISFPITDSFVSFGRGPENSETFEPKTESRVPKYAFKILLWKHGYDPVRDPSRSPPPWQSDASVDASEYSFWISTKASVGVHVNGYMLPSSAAKNPGGPSKYWARLHHGDEILIWGSPGPSKPNHQTNLIFWCMWGASCEPRGDDKKLELASADLAAELDNACSRTEKRIRYAAEKRRKVAKAKAELQERQRHVDRERESSRAFESKRLEAIEYLCSRNMMSPKKDSASAAAASSAAAPSRLLQRS